VAEKTSRQHLLPPLFTKRVRGGFSCLAPALPCRANAGIAERVRLLLRTAGSGKRRAGALPSSMQDGR